MDNDASFGGFAMFCAGVFFLGAACMAVARLGRVARNVEEINERLADWERRQDAARSEEANRAGE